MLHIVHSPSASYVSAGYAALASLTDRKTRQAVRRQIIAAQSYHLADCGYVCGPDGR